MQSLVKKKHKKMELRIKWYCVLSALTSVNAMPLETNATNAPGLISNNYSNAFFTNNYENQTKSDDIKILHLPVDTDADTLIVADRDESENLDPGGHAPKHNPEIVEAIIDAEHDRDVAMAKNTKDKVTVLEIAEDDVDEFRKQLNISSSVLDDIMEAETGRDEYMTDIMFRPEPDYDTPQYAFLAAPKLINESGMSKSNNASIKTGSGQTSGENVTTGERRADYVELVEVMRATPGLNSSQYQLGNVTVHEVEGDVAPDTRFTDLQTLLLACFGTLLPLLLVLLALLLVRLLVRRWCPGCCPQPALASSLSDVSDEKPDLNDEYKPVLSSGRPSSGRDSDEGLQGEEAQLPANGSIITMTLKNNHLIVETEERNDIKKNGRETKMKYSPDSDGIFVVEVQQSVPYRSSKKNHSPPRNANISSNQHALIHRVPDEISSSEEILEADDARNKSSFDKEKSLALSSTGLSISDLSMSSIESRNPSYAYGTQTGYEQGPFGYSVYPGYEVPESSINESSHDNSQEPLISKTPTDPDKPVVTAAIFKQDSIIGNDILSGPGYCIEGSTDGPLLSDVQAREASLHQLHDKMEDKKVENGRAIGAEDHSPTKHFNRADSLPPRLEDSGHVIEEQNLQTIGEDEERSREVSKGKRASLPTITTEVYENMIPHTSPKFEKLTNISSPVDPGPMPPPMITITEEYDNAGYQNDTEDSGS